MHLVADHQIPIVSDLFEKYCKITQKRGDSLTHDDLTTADILLVRSITPVTAALLEKTPVKWVGNCAVGTDHIDLAFLSKQNIQLAQSSGANASTVTDYVAACLTSLSFSTQNCTAGVVGYGHIGKKVAQLLTNLGANIVIFDPFTQNSTSFDQFLINLDLISFHVPLTKTSPHPTFHMLHSKNLALTKKNLVVINTARGSVIEESALLQYPRTLCLDVWENEPAISLALLDRAIVGTPHIAGYSPYAKRLATQMVFNEIAIYFQWPTVPLETPPSEKTPYDPLRHTTIFRQAFKSCKNKEDIAQVFRTQRDAFYKGNV